MSPEARMVLEAALDLQDHRETEPSQREILEHQFVTALEFFVDSRIKAVLANLGQP